MTGQIRRPPQSVLHLFQCAPRSGLRSPLAIPHRTLISSRPVRAFLSSKRGLYYKKKIRARKYWTRPFICNEGPRPIREGPFLLCTTMVLFIVRNWKQNSTTAQPGCTTNHCSTYALHVAPFFLPGTQYYVAKQPPSTLTRESPFTH